MASVAARSSPSDASPSAYLSAVSTAVLASTSVMKSQTQRQHAQAKSRNFLALPAPFTKLSISPGSVQASHSVSVIAPPRRGSRLAGRRLLAQHLDGLLPGRVLLPV